MPYMTSNVWPQPNLSPYTDPAHLHPSIFLLTIGIINWYQITISKTSQKEKQNHILKTTPSANRQTLYR